MNELRNIIIGFQLGRETSQICYYDRKLQEPVSLATKVGSTLYEFPTTLCKNGDIWHFGLEAEYFGKQPGGIYVDSLYQLNEENTSTTVDGKGYEPWELLGIFLKESLKMLGVQDLEKAVSGLMVTAEKLDGPLAANLKKALNSLGLKKGCCRIQNYGESFYYYAMSQKPELRVKKIALLEFCGQRVAFRKLSIQGHTKPALVTLSEKKEYILSDTPEGWDTDLCHVISETMEMDGFSCAYIVGAGFDPALAVQSLPKMAKSARKIYSGNNLFVKGACYSAKEKTEEKRLKEYLYLGEDLVRTNVGMEMIVHGMNVYHPLIMAGMNWYDAGDICEFILDDEVELRFISSAMEGGERKVYAMELPGLPKRPNRTTRLRLEAAAASAKKCCIRVVDLGFGDMFPASGMSWTDTMEL